MSIKQFGLLKTYSKIFCVGKGFIIRFILYLTEEYDELIYFIKKVDFTLPVYNSVKILAQTDNLFSTLLQQTVENKFKLYF